MRKILFLLIITFLSTEVSGQIEVLDTKNGFKTLKFGQSLNEMENLKIISKDEEKEIFLVQPEDPDLLKVFYTKMDNIMLFFENEKLNGVILRKSFSSPSGMNALNEIEKLKEQFVQVLGEPNGGVNEESGVGPEWRGKNVSLALLYELKDIKMQSDGSPLMESVIQVVFLQNSEEELSDGF